MDRSRSDTAGTPLNESTDGRRSKVERVIQKYELGRLGSELEARWTGQAAQRQSLRELADYFNRRLLESVLVESGTTPLDGEVENVYQLLVGDEVSEGTRTQTRMRLEREGVSVEDLLDDFVSHQAIYTYLTECRNAEYPDDAGDGDRVEKETEKVQRLQSRTAAVIEDTVERMRNADRVDIGEFDVLLNARVLCKNCGTYHELGELLDGGGCQCE